MAKSKEGKTVDAELKWLRFFYEVADFGPADGEVRDIIMQEYEDEGGVIPSDYKPDYDEVH